MDIDFERKVDYWIGVPLCFFLSIFYRAVRFIGINKPRYGAAPKKALFMELSEMGSAILAYSSMEKLKDIYPGCNIYFLIFKENKESVSLLGSIPEKNIITIRGTSFLSLIIDTVAALWKIRRLKLDIIFDLELFSRFSSILTALSGANLKVGFYKYSMEGLYRGSLLTHKVTYNPHLHVSLNFMSLVYSLQSQRKEWPLTKRKIDSSEIKAPRLKSDQKAAASIYKKLKEVNPDFKESSRIVVFNPNAGLLPIRAWPLRNYIELAKKIVKASKNVFIVIMGVKDASKDAEAICSVIRDRCIDLTNKTTLRDVVDLFNISKVLVTNDSGPAHFASLTDIRNIVFFGPETPKLYSPLGKNCIPVYSAFACSPCVSAFNHRKTLCKDNKCMQVIGVDEVYNLVKKGL